MPHTPGPWYFSPTGRYVHYDGVHGPNICDLDVFGGPAEEAKANAWLIVSAPDLLASLEEMVANLTKYATLGLNSEEVSMLRRAEFAIARAKSPIP